ncbi:MAG: DegQ family serine endoprotease [Litorivicinus sp.]
MRLIALCIPLILWASTARANLPDFRDLVRDVSPSVVNISTVNVVEAPVSDNRDPRFDQLPDIFRDFFGNPPGGFPRRGPGGPGNEPQSLGSGFIISDDGYVLTNNHVIENAQEIIVRLNDRRELVATLIGADPRSDLALLKIEADDLPAVKMAQPDSLDPGQWVVAIGSPFGFDYSVTAGIVSAVGRSLPRENYVPFIQTDVAINPGNSGGPLFNLDGEVVGINSQIYTRSGGFMGLSFAIPVDMAMDVVDQLIDTGTVERGWLGVLIQEVNRDLAESFGLEKPQGALIAQVVPEGPAASSPLQAGDVVLEFNGREVTRSSDLPPLVGRVRPGQSADVLVWRDGAQRMLKVEIGKLPSSPQAARQITRDTDVAGMSVENVPDNLKAEWDIEGGVLIKGITSRRAQAAGIRVGDVILQIAGNEISGVSDFREIVEQLQGGGRVPVLLVRDGNPTFVSLRL